MSLFESPMNLQLLHILQTLVVAQSGEAFLGC